MEKSLVLLVCGVVLLAAVPCGAEIEQMWYEDGPGWRKAEFSGGVNALPGSENDSHLALSGDISTVNMVYGALGAIDPNPDRIRQFYVSGGWQHADIPPTMVGIQYVGLDSDPTTTQELYGANAAGGLDWLTVGGGGWQIDPIPVAAGTDYVDVGAANGVSLVGVDELIFAAPTTGGIEEMWYSGGSWTKAAFGWGSEIPNTQGKTFLAVSGGTDALGEVVAGCNAAGGIEEFWVEGGWRTAVIPGTENTLYVGIDWDVDAEAYFAARAEGGVDMVHVVPGAGWQIDPVPVAAGIQYVDVAAAGDADFSGPAFFGATLLLPEPEIPEPGTVTLLGLGLLLVAKRR